ncbi:M20 peptidase aminoacylase family protein [Brevibacillus composti]|uniref:M20 peptidase aminoacylase family protein n=1 Tax=Brevibacillus composti TaxID=2796470 RepID=A0A7T5EMU9_9BACL|nr:M20 peptidase aminoacylase family protein [Brevibacillus composti]QQE75500.1 M20 peptidase aminoacylase family protein [Brevibacillus composti]QUO42526.1 M20 peptidase aminoacylase family protein [Brevibacillus composti]
MSVQAICDYLKKSQDDIIRTYEELHLLAEPSWQEEKTSQYLADRLRAAGLAVRTYPGHFGLTVDIEGEESGFVGLRADMDALVQEVNGVVKPNHSCGHDGHSTMVLYAALAFAAAGIRPKKSVRFLFQPAEEKVGGALQMIKDGALEGVEMLFGVHVRPLMELANGTAAPAIIHGASATVHGTISGLQAHASRPERGKNVIETAAVLIHSLQNIRLQAGCPFSVKMTQLSAGGETSNVIPDKATFKLDVRAQSNEGMRELQEKIRHVTDHVAQLMGTPIEWSIPGEVPAAILNEQAAGIMREAIAHVLGAENAKPPCVSPGGEDFHFYTYEKPELAGTMLGLGCGLSPGLHHPEMSFDTKALVSGAQILATALYNAASGKEV